MDKDTIRIVLQSGMALASVLLVFIGFLASRKKADRGYRKQVRVAIVVAVAPFLLATLSAWLCFELLVNPVITVAQLAFWSFQGALGATAVFGAAGAIWYYARPDEKPVKAEGEEQSAAAAAGD